MEAIYTEFQGLPPAPPPCLSILSILSNTSVAKHKEFHDFLFLLDFAMGFKYKEGNLSFLMDTFLKKNPFILYLALGMNNTDV